MEMTEAAQDLYFPAFSELEKADADMRYDRTYDFMTYDMPTKLSYLTFLRLSSIRERIASTSPSTTASSKMCSGR
jgi:hypothetical protein